MGAPLVTGLALAFLGACDDPLRTTEPDEEILRRICGDAGPLPQTLSCTGLYRNVALTEIADAAVAFTPAVPLWSDGSGKGRWVSLPEGATIDRTAPNDWVYPVGTKFWKEFRRADTTIETRFFHKTDANSWRYGSYIWNGSGASAKLAPDGADIKLDGGVAYHVPSQNECNECHGGRVEPVMGFDEVSLGQAGATGLTLEVLAQEGKLIPAPTVTRLEVGDDGTSKASYALGWLHINCGVACHNDNPNSYASNVSMRLRLDATQLDGRPSNSFPSIVTTAGVSVTSHGWDGEVRLRPGDPSGSWLIHLISNRGPANQMPPLGTTAVDGPDVARVTEWIAAMPPLRDAAVDGRSDDDGGGADDDASVSAPGDSTLR